MWPAAPVLVDYFFLCLRFRPLVLAGVSSVGISFSSSGSFPVVPKACASASSMLAAGRGGGGGGGSTCKWQYICESTTFVVVKACR